VNFKLILCLAFILSGSLNIVKGQTNANAQPSKPDIRLIQLQAEIGNAQAQSRLGMAYLGGDGVPKNPAQAFYWFKKAAEQGNAWGEGGVGTAYINGEGVAKDEKEAFKWFKKAADQGFFPAQDQLGVLYVNGMGCEKDSAEAYKWFYLAAQQGYQTATEHMSALTSYMTPDQIYEGQQRAKTFVPIVEDQTNLVVAGQPNSSPANGAAEPKTMAEVQAEVKNGLFKFYSDGDQPDGDKLRPGRGQSTCRRGNERSHGADQFING
jgi:TPR repeat protein